MYLPVGSSPARTDDVVYSANPTLIEDVSAKVRNLQTVPFESVCAGDQTINCGFNGKCISLPTVDNQKQFLCICLDGFTGPRCETGEFLSLSTTKQFTYPASPSPNSLGRLQKQRTHLSLSKRWNMHQHRHTSILHVQMHHWIHRYQLRDSK